MKSRDFINISYFKKVFTLSTLLIVIFVFSALNSHSQRIADSVKYQNHSPHKATIYSLVLPGLGQAYNKQYWKIPILYAGIATITYFAIFNTNKYHTYRDEYMARISTDTTIIPNPKYVLYSDNSIKQLKNYYQRNLEFTYIMAGVVYLLNVIDASVYAHLFTFDVSNNLSMRIDPLFNENAFRFDSPPAAGVKLTFSF